MTADLVGLGRGGNDLPRGQLIQMYDERGIINDRECMTRRRRYPKLPSNVAPPVH